MECLFQNLKLLLDSLIDSRKTCPKYLCNKAVKKRILYKGAFILRSNIQRPAVFICYF